MVYSYLPMALTSNILLDFQWNALLRAIENDRCVICIGPEFYTPPGESRTQSQRLSAFLNEHSDVLGIRVRENGWYHLKADGDDGAAGEAIRQFYETEGENSRDALDKLAQIKSHLLLSLTPDHELSNAFERQGFRCRSDFYYRHQPDRDAHQPTQDQPMVYNLLGDLNERNSLVFTYDDFFSYVESTFRGNSMSTLLKDSIFSADNLIFLGMPEDDWRMHLFLRILRMNGDRKSKYATMPGAEDKVGKSWKEQYGITLVNNDIAGFLDELHLRCSAKGLLREAVRAKMDTSSVSRSMRDLAADNETLRCLELLMHELKLIGPAVKSLLLAAIQIKSRHNTLRDGVMAGVVSFEETTLEENKITKSLLELIDRFEAEAAKIGLSV